MTRHAFLVRPRDFSTLTTFPSPESRVSYPKGALGPRDFSTLKKLVCYCRTTSASTAPCTSRRMCCPTHCASYCAPSTLRPSARLVSRTRGTVTSTMRRAAHSSESARCGAGADCSALKYQSLLVCRAGGASSAGREGEYVRAMDHGKVRGVLDALGVTLPDWPSDVRTPDRSVPFDTGPTPPPS